MVSEVQRAKALQEMILHCAHDRRILPNNSFESDVWC